MSVARSQQQTFLRLLARLRPRWHQDLALPRQIQLILSGERSFGSRDRRLYRELIYTTLRYLPWIEPWLDREPERAGKIAAWLAAENRATLAYRTELCADWPAATTLAERAAFLGADASALLPVWFRPECPEAFAGVELEAQLARAPLWLRMQTEDTAAVTAEFDAHGWLAKPSAQLASAWRMTGEVDVTKTTAYEHGLIEVQDLGSQLVLESVGVEPGGRWLDACAGAGGKTLQLARLLGASGTVDASDIRPEALAELKTRASRAGITNVAVLTAPPTGSYTGVLVDAPCSGSGTWRRAPHLKWTTTADDLAARARVQRRLLEQAAPLVRPGGRLVYATCSLARTENEAVVSAFRQAHPEYEPAPFAHTFGFTPGLAGLAILPALHDTDGFFVASFRRR